MLIQNRRYLAVPEKELFSSRRVYSSVCGDEGLFRISVPQRQLFQSRRVDVTSSCFDGQVLDDWKVSAVPQKQLFTSGGDTRPVYAFSCCPAGLPPPFGPYGSLPSGPSGPSSGPQSGSGSQPSGLQSGSGPSGPSGSSSGPSGPSQPSSPLPDVQVDCCAAGLLLPQILYVTVSSIGSGCACLAGTYQITYQGGLTATWLSTPATICSTANSYWTLLCSSSLKTFQLTLTCPADPGACGGIGDAPSGYSAFANTTDCTIPIITFGPIVVLADCTFLNSEFVCGFCNGSINATVTA